MDSRDEKLTLENVDEQIEECLSPSQELQGPAITSLARTVHDLQSIYEEERRLEHVWACISSRALALGADHVIEEEVDGLAGWGQAHAPTFPMNQGDGPTFSTVQGGVPTFPTVEEVDGVRGRGRANAPTFLRRSDKQSRLPFRRSWYKPVLGLVAAVLLVAFFIWPIVSYAFHAVQTASPKPSVKTVTPQIRSTVNVPKQIQTQTGTKIGSTVTSMSTPIATSPPIATPTPLPTTNALGLKVYSNQYFTIQYPANWVITSVTTGGSYQQTVQFRPSATSSVFVDVNVMYSTSLSGDLLLLADTDVKQGTLLSTSTVSYNGIPWVMGVVSLAGSTQAQSSKEEVAYSNQNAPYKIQFSAPPDMYSSYAEVFDAMFASFYPI